ncbi:TrbC/VirB2 family protein, partial [Xanthomonas hortorum]|uniref:TrbC/VirB2 family protein n=1 Tax=Xanthomonas hortorum TaxID=56454 RepID=UPI0032E92CEE
KIQTRLSATTRHSALSGRVIQTFPKAIGVISIVVCGLAMANSQGGTGMKQLMMVLLGLSIAFTASTFFLSFLGFGGGAVF